MKKYLIILLTGIGSTLCLYSQSLSPTVVASGGGYYTGANGSVSYTLGELAIETYAADSTCLTQGFQQSYTITVLVENPVANMDIIVYPVPTSHFLNITFQANADINHIATLFDMNGNQIIRQDVHSTTIKMDLQHIPPAGYVLQITRRNGMFVKSFMVIIQ